MTFLILTIKFFQHITYRSYNITKYIKIALFATLTVNFLKLWHDNLENRVISKKNTRESDSHVLMLKKSKSFLVK